MRMTKLAGALTGVVLVLAGCGGDDDPAATQTTLPAAGGAETTDGAATTDPAGAETTDGAATTDPGGDPGAADEAPARIVSLSPTHTEILFAIGAADQVVAVDEFSNHPPEAAGVATDLSGWAPNVEAIAGYDPDLVVHEGTASEMIEQLERLGIPHWAGPAPDDFAGVYEQIEQLGAATGNVGGAAEVVLQMQTEIDEITAGLPDLDRPLTYYHELDDTLFTVTSETFIGHVYGQLGLRSIADLAESSAGPYLQLNAEFILSEDPDLIFQACSVVCGETAETMAARDGWDQLSAVQNGLVFELNDDVVSRWGPRIVDFYRDAAAAIDAVAIDGAATVEPAG